MNREKLSELFDLWVGHTTWQSKTPQDLKRFHQALLKATTKYGDRLQFEDIKDAILSSTQRLDKYSEDMDSYIEQSAKNAVVIVKFLRNTKPLKEIE